MPPRVIFDSNLYVSYLLTLGKSENTVQQLFECVLSGEIELVLLEAVLQEVEDKVATKRSLHSRIAPSAAASICGILREIAAIVPVRDITMTPTVGDPDDDYVLTYAVEEHADIHVSGDKDLLALGDTIPGLKIRSPQAFLDDIGSEPPSIVG